MIDYHRLKYDGRTNSINGIRYRYSSLTNSLSFYGISFLVANVSAKKKNVKVTMHADVNHERAHVHVGDHEASFAIDDGSLLVGQCDSKVQRDVETWINNHRTDLLALWDTIKDGKPRDELIKKIKNN